MYYVVYISRPNVDSKNMRFKMVTEHKNIIGDSRAFDGSILYLPIKITDKVGSITYTCTRMHIRHITYTTHTHCYTYSMIYVVFAFMQRVTCTSVRPTDGATINIHITLVKVLKHHECIHLFNVILKRIMKILEMNQIGRNYYDPHHPVPVPQHK